MRASPRLSVGSGCRRDVFSEMLAATLRSRTANGMRLSHRLALPLVVACLAVVSSPEALRAQTDHQSTTQDIEAGSRLYASQCTTCHGAAGDTVSGIKHSAASLFSGGTPGTARLTTVTAPRQAAAGLRRA
jgi:mono/diheme cytochrome c family protein